MARGAGDGHWQPVEEARGRWTADSVHARLTARRAIRVRAWVCGCWMLWQVPRILKQDSSVLDPPLLSETFAASHPPRNIPSSRTLLAACFLYNTPGIHVPSPSPFRIPPRVHHCPRPFSSSPAFPALGSTSGMSHRRTPPSSSGSRPGSPYSTHTRPPPGKVCPFAHSSTRKRRDASDHQSKKREQFSACGACRMRRYAALPSSSSPLSHASRRSRFSAEFGATSKTCRSPPMASILRVPTARSADSTVCTSSSSASVASRGHRLPTRIQRRVCRVEGGKASASRAATAAGRVRR